MKKIVLLFCLGALTLNTHAQLASKGSSFLQVGYGFPSTLQLIGGMFKLSINTEDVSASSSFKYKGVGPIHARYEYMLGGRVGLGLSANAELGKFTFTNAFTDIDGTYFKSVTEFDYSSINALARMNFHFLKRNEKLDLYYGMGIGYAHTRVKLRQTLEGDVLTQEELDDIKLFNDYLNSVFKFFPVAIEEVFGGRVALGPQAGMYFEVGASKAIAQIGFYTKLGGNKGYYRDNWKWY